MSSGPEDRQIITANGGFAYGAIDGDVIVVAPGKDRYLIQPWRDLTSDAARAATVAPSQLAEWRDHPVPLALRWLHGGSIEARARLCRHLAATSIGKSWAVSSVKRIVPTESEFRWPVGSDVLGTAVDSMFLIENAHEWELRGLTWLLSNAVFQRPGARTRVLLIADNADYWPRLRGSLDGLHPALSTEAVKWTISVSDRGSPEFG